MNTVEARDRMGDLVENITSMIQRRRADKSVAVKDKLIVAVEGEVYVSSCDKFILFKPLHGRVRMFLTHLAGIEPIENELLVFFLSQLF